MRIWLHDGIHPAWRTEPSSGPASGLVQVGYPALNDTKLTSKPQARQYVLGQLKWGSLGARKHLL